jgi:hypothetical protein
MFPPSKKTKLLFFWIERKNYSSFRPLAPPRAAQKLHASMGWKILTVDLTPCGWVASHPASKFASYNIFYIINIIYLKKIFSKIYQI